MTELWRHVKGTNKIYSVSNYGRVKSNGRWCNSRWGVKQYRAGKILSLITNKSGHLFVGLHIDGKQKQQYVHHLVLVAFIGPRPSGMQCRHLDGDATNNHAANLRWGTQKENAEDKVKHGVCYHPTGVKNTNASLNEKIVKKIRRLYATGLWLQREIAELFGVTQGCISRITTGRGWRNS